MIKKYLISAFAILLTFCTNKTENRNDQSAAKVKEPIKTSRSEPKTPTTEYNKLEFFIDNFEPKNFNLSKDLNDSLKKYDVEFIFNNTDLTKTLHIIHVSILKNFYFSFYNSNLSYNLLPMKIGKTAIIIDKYIKIYKLENYNEGISSGLIYEQLKRNKRLYKNDKLVNKLLKKIDSLKMARGYGQFIIN